MRRIKVALRDENIRPWHEVEHDFLESEYRAVRDRQMKELENEDDLLSKVPVRCVTKPCLTEAPLIHFVGTYERSFIKSHMNLSGSNASSVCYKENGS